MGDRSRTARRARSMEAELAAICQSLESEPGQQPSLEPIARLAVQTVVGSDECSITLRRADGGFELPACTSPLAHRLGELQHRMHQGPSVDAVRAMDVCVAGDLGTENRWPGWTPDAARLGIGSVLSVRMETSSDVLGALTLYAGRPSAFDTTSAAIARIYGRHTANALADAERAHQLELALTSRRAIGIAQGMLMQRYGTDDDHAFEALRRYAERHGLTVRELSERIAAAHRITGGITDLPTEHRDASGAA